MNGIESVYDRIEEKTVQIKQFLLKYNLFNYGLMIILISVLSIYFPFPLHELITAFGALIFPGYLFYRLVIKNPPVIETIVLSVILSIGIIVFFTFILTAALNFPFDRTTIISASVLSNVIFLGIHFIKGIISE